MVTDNDIIQLFNDNGNPNTSMLKRFKYLDIDIQTYVKNRWSDIPEIYYTNKESIFRIINNIQLRPTCKYCGKPVKYIGKSYLDKKGKTINGYKQYCSFECSCKDINRIKKIENTCLKKYGVKNPFQSTTIKDKIKQNNIKKYGVEYTLQSSIIRDKIKNTCIQKYGVDHIWKSEIIKNNIKHTNLKLYGTENIAQSQYYIDICKKHNVFKYSKLENELYDILISLFSEHDIVRQYKSDVYPYKCDFYLKSYNLYIEYHGSWFHNYHRFNKTSDIDKRILDMFINKNKKSYDMAIKTWTFYDPMKLDTAIKNNLNYFVIYPNIDFNILTKSLFINIKGIKVIGEFIKQKLNGQ